MSTPNTTTIYNPFPAQVPSSIGGIIPHTQNDSELNALSRELDQAEATRWKIDWRFAVAERKAPEPPEQPPEDAPRAWQHAAFEQYMRWYTDAGLEAIAGEDFDHHETVVSPIENSILSADTVNVAGIGAVARILRCYNRELWFDGNLQPIEPDDIDDWGKRQIRRLVDDAIALADKGARS